MTARHLYALSCFVLRFADPSLLKTTSLMFSTDLDLLFKFLVVDRCITAILSSGITLTLLWAYSKVVKSMTMNAICT